MGLVVNATHWPLYPRINSVPVRPVNYNNPNQWLPTAALSNGTANFEVISDRAIELLRKPTIFLRISLFIFFSDYFLFL
jgi:hypothetical protein